MPQQVSVRINRNIIFYDLRTIRHDLQDSLSTNKSEYYLLQQPAVKSAWEKSLSTNKSEYYLLHEAQGWAGKANWVSVRINRNIIFYY